MSNILFLQETDSTNNHLKRLLQSQNLREGFTLHADFQTSGRGQQGNGWESENHKNLLFTTLFRLHDIPVASQFLFSQLIPLAIVQSLNETFPQASFTIKWPNDIYYKDKKLAGILIEHSLAGNRLDWSIAGIGINVNQTVFKSKAPNPISLKQILQVSDIDRFTLLEHILQRFADLRPLLHQSDDLKQLYMANLYRANGFYPYIEALPSTEPIMNSTHTQDSFYAKIEDILPDGRLALRLHNTNELRTYHFKQVRFCIFDYDLDPDYDKVKVQSHSIE